MYIRSYDESSTDPPYARTTVSVIIQLLAIWAVAKQKYNRIDKVSEQC